MNDPIIFPNNEHDLLVPYNRHNLPSHWVDILWTSVLGKACHSRVKDICKSSNVLICWFFPGPPTQRILNVFDWVHIRGYGRPRKNDNVIFCQKLSCNQCGLGSCIVMLESNTGTLITEKLCDTRTQDVVDITTSIQIALYYNHHLTPNQQTAPTHQIHPFPARSNPQNARLCGDEPRIYHQHD